MRAVAGQDPTVSYQRARMIVPPLEAETHSVEVAGMALFEDNNHLPAKGDPIGARLAAVAPQGFLPMGC